LRGVERPRVAVVDIDGVLADVRHRLHHLESRPKDWRRFFAAAAQDEPLAEGLARVAGFLDEGMAVLFLTGRPESLRRTTEAWLERHGLDGHGLVMRRGRDFRPARLAKADELRRIAEAADVVVVLDDDPEVVDHLRDQGWPVELATWVPHSRTLRQAQEADGRT
jgi:phosphoglycolate phosphatase-like HAD superfamily hydrolase